MNAESPRLRSTETTSTDIRAIWPGALLSAYLTATAALLVFGRARVAAAGLFMHVAVLAAVVAATWAPAVPRWLRRWAPLLALLFLYTEMPILIRAAGHDALYDTVVAQWERALFGGQPAIEWAARWPSRFLSEVLHAAYLSYYLIIFSVPGALYLTGKSARFSEAVFVLMATFVACFVCYIVFPVAGPRYLWPSPTSTIGGPIRSAAHWLLEARSSRGTAFPSSHVAVAATQSILALRYFGLKGLPIAVISVGLAIGAVYGGFHYLIDVLCGGLLGTLVAGAGIAWFARAPRFNHANASAPTYPS